MHIEYPHAVGEILDRLHRAGYEAHIVGGSLRDSMLGRPPHDWDVTTSALPEQTLEVFSSSRTLTTGLKHGTITVLAEENGEPLPVEITTYRIDGEYADARHPTEVTFTRSIADDLARRDFTVCAMAWSPYGPGDGLVDLFCGRDDLDARIIRCVGEPKLRFREDALRILRAYRFAAELSFDIDPATRAAANLCAELLSRISAERICAELSRTVVAPNAVRAMTMMAEDSVLASILPSVTHAEIAALDALPPILSLRLAALLHHESLTQAADALLKLRFSNEVIRRVGAALALRDFPLGEDHALTARRLLREGGLTAAEDVLALRSAFGEPTEGYSSALGQARERGDCTDLAHLALNGQDLAALGIPRGPIIGRLLNHLLDAVIEEPARNDREQLTALVLTWKDAPNI
ncbi:MAG: polynucleotide adenylyltransferase [Clostridia bacterium]|nr:polynucleotide adenylyltransferase [Clostridia bacterium]